MFRTICLALLSVWGALSAQGLRGRITTPEGAPISYVRVNVVEQQVGTLSDEQGRYQLKLPPGEHVVLFTHLGYRQHQVEVVVPQDRTLDVILMPSDLTLGPVDIEGGKRDPAYDIMAELIEHRKERLRQYESYTCDTYLKVKLEVDTLRKEPQPDSLLARDTTQLVHLIESQSKTHFAQPNRYKSIVQAYRHHNPNKSQSVGNSLDGIGNQYSSELDNPYLFYLDISQADFNFYESFLDVPKVSDRPLVSPLNPLQWKLNYAFRLEERFYQDDRVHYRIRIAPRNRSGPYLRGEIIVVDGDWALREVKLTVQPSAMGYFTQFELRHHYERTPDGRWLLTEEHYRYQIEERKLLYRGESTALHSDYELDVDFPERFFKNELRRTEQAAFERDSSYWEGVRPMGLGASEQAFIETQDSIIAHRSSAEFLRKMDSAQNRITFADVVSNGVRFADRAHGMWYAIDPLLRQIQPFGVGGFRYRLGGSVTKMFPGRTRLSVRGQADYGFVNQDLKGEGRVRYLYAPRRFGSFYVQGGDTYKLVTVQTTISSIFSRNNIINKVYFGAGHSIELVNGLYLDLGFDFADRQAIDSLEIPVFSSEIFAYESAPVLGFDPYREFLVDMKLRYTPAQPFFTEPYRKIVLNSPWPTFTLHYKKAIPGLFQSEIDYDYLALEAEQDVAVGSMGTSRWRLKAARFLRAPRIEVADYTFIRGSDPFIFANPLQLYQLLDTTTIRTRQAYLSAHYLHAFQGALMDKVPLIKRIGLQSTAGASTLLLEEGNLWHTELFVGLQRPFRIRYTRFKVGVFYTTSYGNFSNALQGEFKVGLTFFDTRRNEWDY